MDFRSRNMQTQNHQLNSDAKQKDLFNDLFKQLPTDNEVFYIFYKKKFII